jgi:protein-disulfide isomerase
MNIKRTLFWLAFVIIIILIVWGMIVAMNKQGLPGGLGTPGEVTSADWVIGNKDAKVTLLEYGDFQCPACATYFGFVEKLYAEASTSMRLVFRHFPLPQHQNAIPAALAAEAAGKQGKFWDMYRLLYSNQLAWAESSEATRLFTEYATSHGLNTESFNKDMQDASLRSKITSQSDEGVRIGVNSTPTFFINGKVVTNPNSYAEFKKLVDEAISNNQ